MEATRTSTVENNSRGRAALVGLCLFLGLVFGCAGWPDLELSLPNGHRFVSLHEGHGEIVMASDITAVISAIETLDTDDHYIFGEGRDPNANGRRYYFIRDTSARTTVYFDSLAEWHLELSSMGIEQANLRTPTVFFHLQTRFWWRFVPGFVIVLAVVILFVIPTLLTWRIAKRNWSPPDALVR